MNKEIYKIDIHTNFVYYYYLISTNIDDFRNKYVKNSHFYTNRKASITKTRVAFVIKSNNSCLIRFILKL